MTRHDVDDRSYIDRRVETVDAAVLEPPVRRLLDDPGARLTGWSSERIAYDFLNPSSGGIYRFVGSSSRGEWSLVLKVTRSTKSLVDAASLPVGLAEIRAEAVRWDRELIAYESGFLADLDGLAAADCYGGSRHDDGTAWLWLEDLGGAATGTWPLERWSDVGRALGRFNGAYLAAGSVPEHVWLGRNWLRVWVTRLTPFHMPEAVGWGEAWERPAVRAAYPPAFQERLRRLWANRETLLRAVEALPRTVSHLDAHRRNLFLREGEVVAIDWGLLGLAAPGEEIASTLVGTVASGELLAEEAPALAEILYRSYVEGLRDAGWTGDERDVRLAFTTAAGLRAFSILGVGAAEAPQLERAARLAALLVGLGEEALRLRPDLELA